MDSGPRGSRLLARPRARARPPGRQAPAAPTPPHRRTARRGRPAAVHVPGGPGGVPPAGDHGGGGGPDPRGLARPPPQPPRPRTAVRFRPTDDPRRARRLRGSGESHRDGPPLPPHLASCQFCLLFQSSSGPSKTRLIRCFRPLTNYAG